VAGLSLIAANKAFLFDLDKEIYAREMKLDFELREVAEKLVGVLDTEVGWKELYENSIHTCAVMACGDHPAKRALKNGDGDEESDAKVRRGSLLRFPVR
jgi:hypothetical protein